MSRARFILFAIFFALFPFITLFATAGNAHTKPTATSIRAAGPNFPLALGMPIRDGIAGKPAIAFDGSNFLAVFKNDADDILATRVSTAGMVLDTIPISIATGLNEDAYPPAVAFDGTTYLVVWFATRDATNEVYGARVTPEGIVLDPGGRPLTSGANPKIRMPTLLFDGSNYLVAWRDGYDRIQAAQITPDLTNLNGPTGIRVNDKGFYPAVAFDGSNYLIVWYYWGTGGLDVFGRRLDLDGNLVDGESFAISAGPYDESHPNVGYDGHNFWVAWHDANGDTLRATRISPQGAVLDDPPLLLAQDAVAGTAPQLACAASDCLVAWTESIGDVKMRLSDVYARRVAADGSLLESFPLPVATSVGHQSGTVLGYGAERYLVAWNESVVRDPDGGIWAQLLARQATAVPEPDEGTATTRASRATWEAETVPDTSGGIYAGLAFASENGYAFSTNRVHHYTGTWQTTNGIIPEGRSFGSWAAGLDDIWVTGWCRHANHYDGLTWQDHGCHGTNDTSYVGTAIWAPGDGTIWIAGDRGSFAYRDEYGSWRDVAAPLPYDLWDIWAFAPDQAYAVGERGTVLYFDGAGWTVVGGVPTQQTLNGVWANDDGDLLAVGDHGTILRYDGNSWRVMDSGSGRDLFDIWGSSLTDVYAVGAQGTILHYDGSRWLAETSGSVQDLASVWGFDDESQQTLSLWSSGNGSDVLHQVVGYELPVTPILTITRSGGIISLTWSADPDNCGYQVYSSTISYSGFSLVTTLGQEDTYYRPAEYGRASAYFYVEALACVGRERARSETVGWFRFSLYPGG